MEYTSSKTRHKRKEMITKIEQLQASKVLVYFCGDRPNLMANIHPEAVRWIYEHLLSMNNEKNVDKIDLYLYSRGGALEAPWQIITILRQFCKTLHVLIPYKAYSAATLLALGADKIMMGKKGELGPIDPQMVGEAPSSSQIPKTISVEDITSYISFIKEKVGLTDQNALSALTKTLADNLSPPTLGQINRTHSHIRLVAGKMLALVKPPIDNVKINQIVESLTEKIYVHGHSIGRDEANQIGIQTDHMDSSLEKLCWDLFLEYEKLTKLNSPPNPLAYFNNDKMEEYEEEDAIIACIESAIRYHECSGPLSFKIRRTFPQPVNIAINLPIQLPVGLNAQHLPNELQPVLQQLQQHIMQQTQNLVSEQIRNQSTVTGVDIRAERVVWREIVDSSSSSNS